LQDSNFNCVTTLSILVIVNCSYCCMCFILLWLTKWAFPWTWLSKFTPQNC